MSASSSARFPWTLTVIYAVCAVVVGLLGAWGAALAFGFTSIFLAVCGLVIHIKHKKHERQSNGRYRKASEAHRVGAGRSAGDRSGAGAGGGARGTGAGMNPYLNPYRRGTTAWHAWEQVNNRVIAQGGVTTLPAHALPHTHVVAVQPTARPDGEFDGKRAEFAAGVVTGTRSFDVDNLGRLLGVSFRAVWLPGENEAKCMERDDADYYRQVLLGGSPTRGPQVRESRRPAHSIVECAHGFYGYYEGSNDFYEPGRVMGVVEAYGETIIGTRGFRASKARIVALHIPDEVSVGKRRLITRNYQGVPVFDSFEAMISEFPPDDAGQGLGPDTDPDFWTREVAS